MRKTITALLALLPLSTCAVAQEATQTVGITPVVKLEEIISGHLVELNGKFKLRATEVTIAPGGALGAHHHAGPGVRFVVAGELTFTQAGKAIIYRPGDYFYESGNVVHTAHNRTKAPVRVVFVEVLPASYSGSSVIAPKQ